MLPGWISQYSVFHGQTFDLFSRIVITQYFTKNIIAHAHTIFNSYITRNLIIIPAQPRKIKSSIEEHIIIVPLSHFSMRSSHAINCVTSHFQMLLSLFFLSHTCTQYLYRVFAKIYYEVARLCVDIKKLHSKRETVSIDENIIIVP